MNEKGSYISNDKYANNLGIELVKVETEFARCELEINENHKNGLGTLHGAVIFALADIAFAAACNTVNTSIGMQADIKFLNKPEGSRLIAEANIVSGSNKIGHYHVRISDNEGVHVAEFNSISYRFPPKP
ncbi:PaaI family thioesterase [Vibrio hannami]|uniref:PaaI family thioesterase n=1 Tax=Vibrio hannami TaxID=2717094 RepID=UPI003EBA4C41